MRSKIIKNLANKYNEKESYIHNVINTLENITPYKEITIRKRKVIDNGLIPKDEQILLDYYKLLLNYNCKLSFPNRSYIMTELMNIIPYMHLYNRYTIYKFDFKDFFYNVSPEKSFKYVIESINLRPRELSFLKKYNTEINKYIPGIGLHNSLVEVSGKRFDFEIKSLFNNKGIIYFARYVDDCILILDEKASKSTVESVISKAVVKTFGNKLKINEQKSFLFDSDAINYEINYFRICFSKRTI